MWRGRRQGRVQPLYREDASCFQVAQCDGGVRRPGLRTRPRSCAMHRIGSVNPSVPAHYRVNMLNAHRCARRPCPRPRRGARRAMHSTHEQLSRDSTPDALKNPN
ncbi:hypothetical protein EVAR_22486_1 [Eumeta japonica]|uniref:Uncharacterized protein n=1 Tax=Eumeta variegata TaxID=151549 RepID=A0A4C1VEG7_EUMVA|nr:hypothetical protein EVAR_22486_1 [Eumeta japonica]